MKMNKSIRIFIPQWFEQTNPICAGFCEMINDTLRNAPDMSLSKFASLLNEVMVVKAERQLVAIEQEQLKEIMENLYGTKY